MKELVYTGKGDLISRFRSSCPAVGQTCEVYQCGLCSDGYLVRGYEDGGSQCFPKESFREPHFQSRLTEELADKWEYQERELAEEQDYELNPKVFRTDAEF